MVTGKVLLDLVEQVGGAVAGSIVEASVADADVAMVERWCERSGHRLLSMYDGVGRIRRGPTPDDEAAAQRFTCA